jgi:hypothetical protein
MKYTIAGFQQAILMTYGLGVDEAEILRCIVDFWFSKRMETKIIDGKEFFYLAYGFIQSELPILDIDRKQISNKMQKFVECGLMDYRVEKTARGTRVYFSIDEEVYLPLIEIPGERKVEAKEKTKYEDPAKVERGELKKYFEWLYELKAKECTGRDLSPEGKRYLPAWGAKQATMMLRLHTAHGAEALKRFMRLFFSDTINEIAQFTRYYRKAGYAFEVFNGCVPKLVLVSNDIKEPCRECGHWTGHAASCPVERQRLALLKSEAEQTLKEREENPEQYDVDLVSMFHKEINKPKE